MRRFSRFMPLTLLLLAAGCQNDSRLGPSGLPKGDIDHVVIIWMTDRGDEFAKKEILGDAKKLEKIPGVLRVAAGRVLTSDRAKVDNSYDIALIMTFANETDLRHYTEDKNQVQAMANILRYARDVKVYDVVAE